VVCAKVLGRFCYLESAVKKGRHRRYEEARALKRGPDLDINALFTDLGGEGSEVLPSDQSESSSGLLDDDSEELEDDDPDSWEYPEEEEDNW